MKKIGLLPRLILGIIFGIIVGLLSFKYNFAIPTQILVTFSSIFGQFLGFVVPLLIIAFIAPGIAELGNKAGKLLGITAGIAYLSTVVAGTFAYFVASTLLPKLIPANSHIGESTVKIAALFEIEIEPIMGVMGALVIAFVLGLGMASIKGKAMYNVLEEFHEIINKVIKNIIIPFLPIHIAGIFSEMAYVGEVASTLAIFGKVLLLAVAMHLLYLVFQYTIAGSVVKKNPFALLKNMLPAYFTAIGTQSSAATIPITLESTKKNGVKDEIAEFTVPLCATIHLSGSTITLTTCALAVLLIDKTSLSFGDVLPFIMMLGVTMIAAPGVPGGAVMAALGLLSSMLGFSEAQLGLMMALYMAQDSFGTATNVTGDGAISLLVDKFASNDKDKAEVEVEVTEEVIVEA